MWLNKLTGKGGNNESHEPTNGRDQNNRTLLASKGDLLHDSAAPSQRQVNPASSQRGTERRDGTGLMGFIQRGAADAETERRVNIAARNFGNALQKVVTDAKANVKDDEGQSTWRQDLLHLLDGDDEQGGLFTNAESDVETLVENIQCDKFVIRCVENDLLSNLINCLKLLRVIELQHVKACHEGGDITEATSVSSQATAKISRILVELCIDPSIGELMRPHLKGLIALVGAPYPQSAVHIPNAASSVVEAFAENCLTTPIVSFLHEERLIYHMADDIKESCRMTAAYSGRLNYLCAFGEAAEEAGLWVVSLRALVTLVVCSCDHHCLDLLDDFEIAGGYEVLCYAIANSSPAHVKKLLELVTILACCRTELEPDTDKPTNDEAKNDGEMEDSVNADREKENSKLATNPTAFNIVEDLMVMSLPLLVEFDQTYGGDRPEITSQESLRELIAFSMRTALDVRFTGRSTAGKGESDLAMELLVTTLQMYSDHAKNYDVIEERHSILSFYLLAYPTFEDVSLKVLILKTLEYVLTGVGGADAIKPLIVATEVFFAVCECLLKGIAGIKLRSEEEEVIFNDLLVDAEMLCGTIEKLLEFDSRVAPIMLDGGILTVKLGEVLNHVMHVTDIIGEEDESAFVVGSKLFTEPPKKTALDTVFSAVCRVLKLVVQNASSILSETYSVMGEERPTNLNVLLATAVCQLGDDAAAAALRVFEARMASETILDTLQGDMYYVTEVLSHLAELTGRLRNLSAFRPKSKDNKKEKSEIKRRPVSNVTILRTVGVLQMLKSVLEVNTVAQGAFRRSDGFECILRSFICLEGVISDQKNRESKADPRSPTTTDESVLKLLEASLGVLKAATVSITKTTPIVNLPDNTSVSSDILTQEMAMHFFCTPSLANKLYLQHRGFYIDFTISIASTGILRSSRSVSAVLDLCLSFVDSGLTLRDPKSTEAESQNVLRLENPDAARLLMGVATCIPANESGNLMSKKALDEILRLCAPGTTGSTLLQMSKCGLCYSITSRNEFGHILGDRSHRLYSRFVLLLRRIAAFGMTFMDFVVLMRSVAGPILIGDGKDTRIRLPVITASVKSHTAYQVSHEEMISQAWQAKEADHCNRLETLCVIAERGDRVPRCCVGGDSLSTIAVYMPEVPIEERLYTMAQEERLRFIEIECIDMAALGPEGVTAAGIQAAGNSGERIWTPLSTSGFSFSLWLRFIQPAESQDSSSLFVLDLSSPNDSQALEYISVWYDILNQRFNVLSSASYRNEATCFPVSPLKDGVWHHILLTYSPPKRPMLSRKAILGMFVDGRPLEAEVKVESVNLPPNSRVHIGVPNPSLATSGYIRGALPCWEVGPTVMLATILSNLDATAIYTSGPEFEGMFWGDRPQRLSLAATGTAAFAMLAESGEQGSVAGALRRREIPRLEAAGTVQRDRQGMAGINNAESDSLSSLGLLCSINPDLVLFGFRASSTNEGMRDDSLSSKKFKFALRMVNIARMNAGKPDVATDAIIYGSGSVTTPHSFADNVQWAGGPDILLPIVNAARSPRSLALALRLLHESVKQHNPNLEMLQARGGYKRLAFVLRQRKIIDSNVLDQCFAFAVHGFVPRDAEPKEEGATGNSQSARPESWPNSEGWLFSDLDAMKYLLLNHQVWDMTNSGPEMPLRFVSFLNRLVAQNSTHKAFNSRRLHLLGIVRWTLHLMLEAAELYALGEAASAYYANTKDDDAVEPPSKQFRSSEQLSSNAAAAYKNGWVFDAPSVEATSVGGDPNNPLLQSCKTLLRRVLTFMLTPGDLEAISEAAIYTVSIAGGKGGGNSTKQEGCVESDSYDEPLMPGPVARVYLLRLIEELVVDGVNEIVASATDSQRNTDGQGESVVQPHNGGGATTSQSYLATVMMRGSASSGNHDDFMYHPKHKQAQAFLNAFAGVLTPVWFACLLEGCNEEASSSAVLRLMILMLQSSPMFAVSFEESGGFAPLVLSIPKFSTCASITLSMLSHLLHAPILHVPCFGVLDATQLCEVFDGEKSTTEISLQQSLRNHHGNADPSCGIFALLAECLGRNIQLAPQENRLGSKARQTNEAVLKLLSHSHGASAAFQEFCRSPDFLEPLAQALCLVHDEKMQRMQQMEGTAIPAPLNTFTPNLQATQQRVPKGSRRRGSLAFVPKNESATERFVGKEEEGGIGGIGMVQLLRLVVSHAVLSGPLAAPLVGALFRSFPIHASPEQVEAFHLVLIEHCKSVVEEALQQGDPIALANCVGVSSVLLDRLIAGFFTSEPTLEAVNTILSTLGCLVTTGSPASRTLGDAEQNMLTADAAHLARMTCLVALHGSRPMGPYDEGDEDLQTEVLDCIAENLQSLLLAPAGGGVGGARRGGTKGAGNTNPAFPTPSQGSRIFPLWQSASLARCSSPGSECTYPDLSVMPEPDRAFVVALMDELHVLLFDHKLALKEKAVSVVIALLQQRRGVMSELLIAEAVRGDRVETIDIMNRGGFGALLVAHEAATHAENSTTVPRRGEMDESQSKYASFFQWMERSQVQVETVFDNIHVQSSRLFVGLEAGAATPEDAIENEQKSMLLRLTSQDSSDRTILGGLERAELAQRCYDKTSESHLLWKRQGFDDLSAGGLQWKVLLRQLKGSCSLWEGGYHFGEESPFSKKVLLNFLINRDNDHDKKREEPADGKTKSSSLVTRWKLDLTEGYERQRRRMLPNYEWYGLYMFDEDSSSSDEDDDSESSEDSVGTGVILMRSAIGGTKRDPKNSGVPDFLGTSDVQGAADLLNKLKIKKKDDNDDYFDDIEDEMDMETAITTGMSSANDSEAVPDAPMKEDGTTTIGENEPLVEEKGGNAPEGAEAQVDQLSASSYDLITGLLNPGDWPEKSYNVVRCMGLEVVKALLLWCRGAVYIIDGFELTEGEGLEGKIERVEKEQSAFSIVLIPKKDKHGDTGEGKEHRQDDPKNKSEANDEQEDVTFNHRSQRISFEELHSMFQRRYQLQNVALEIFDTNRNGTLVAFNSENEREEVLNKILSSSLPNSIFSSSNGASINYKRFMTTWKSKIISQWVNGKMTNFDLLMHMNSFAGRSYNDLTQYPVMPWIIADYSSEELDLEDPKTYRDLSKPMGAQDEDRAEQFREKYKMYEESGMEPAHYGTHYSCAGYVLHYLLRLEPFSRLALRLQGGKFDVPDRLFFNIESSWKSASAENQQDVRELIPEFFYLSEFLVNKNHFYFGETMGGIRVDDVKLPPWAKGSPERFVRINRQALESNYVSRHLNQWIDLIFGYKQRGREAVEALNVFPHYSYEGNIDIDSLDDPILRDAAIQSAQNFGQTPKCIERRPFATRTVVVPLKDRAIDFGSLLYLAPLTPPFCIVGAPQRIYLRPTLTDICRVGMVGQTDPAVGDLCLVKGQIIGLGRTCALMIRQKKYYRFGGPNNGVSVHVASVTTRHRELNKMLSIHDSMHRAPICIAKASLNGRVLVTGCIDSTVRVWDYDHQSTLGLKATLCGHEAGYINCIDISTTFGLIVTGCSRGRVVLWDLRSLTFLRRLRHPFKEEADKLPGDLNYNPATSVSINQKNGNIVTLVGSYLSLFDINAGMIACKGPGREYGLQNKPTCAISTDCPEWMEQGIVAITGHANGDILMWGMNYDTGSWRLRHVMQEKPHVCAITAIRCDGERQDTLLVGDKSGRVSICKTLPLEHLNQKELNVIASELRRRVTQTNAVIDRNAIANDATHHWIGYVTGTD